MECDFYYYMDRTRVATNKIETVKAATEKLLPNMRSYQKAQVFENVCLTLKLRTKSHCERKSEANQPLPFRVQFLEYRNCFNSNTSNHCQSIAELKNKREKIRKA